ncbi:hypothetical protein SDC9_130625 [bioreactor metagenome]|uniref:Uncharacterized protein n=1 Tax=bioreactor metagenome TaxID=1076179 RepID=A0A645D330_9ZZZZ
MKTIQDFAAYKNISINVINTWIYRHELPVIKIGRRNYIDEADYITWQSDHRKVIGKEQTAESEMPVVHKKSRVAAKMKKIY